MPGGFFFVTLSENTVRMYKSIEICAGAGGQALGLEMAGFEHVALVEYEPDYCECLRKNRPGWNVECMDVRHFDGRPYRGEIDTFTFPPKEQSQNATVGDAIYDLMAAKGWKDAMAWRHKACKIAPTLVGGSKKHGGPDLGSTRARQAWAELGIDGRGVANEAPEADFTGMPRLTPRMLARLQGFPDDWDFGTKKTTACRMIGNAFPPPVAKAVGLRIKEVLDSQALDLAV